LGIKAVDVAVVAARVEPSVSYGYGGFDWCVCLKLPIQLASPCVDGVDVGVSGAEVYYVIRDSGRGDD